MWVCTLFCYCCVHFFYSSNEAISLKESQKVKWREAREKTQHKTTKPKNVNKKRRSKIKEFTLLSRNRWIICVGQQAIFGKLLTNESILRSSRKWFVSQETAACLIQSENICRQYNYVGERMFLGSAAAVCSNKNYAVDPV